MAGSGDEKKAPEYVISFPSSFWGDEREWLALSFVSFSFVYFTFSFVRRSGEKEKGVPCYDR